MKFQASSHLLRLYRLVCVGPGRKPHRPLFFFHVAALYYSCHNLLAINIGNDGMHYENLPMQYTEIFKVVKIENFL